jgi:hypothetical protein
MALPSEKTQLCSMPQEILLQICKCIVLSVVDVGFIDEVEEHHITLARAEYTARGLCTATTPEDIAALPEGLRPLVPSNTGWNSITTVLSCKLLRDITTELLHRSTTIRFQNPSMIPPLLAFENISFEIGQHTAL